MFGATFVPPATLGRSASTSTFNTFTITAASGVWQDTLMQITLPSTGLYEVFGLIRIYFKGNTGTYWNIALRLYDFTLGAAICTFEGMYVTNTQAYQLTVPLRAIYTVPARSTVVRLHANRLTDGTFTTSQVYADATYGDIMMGYIQL